MPRIIVAADSSAVPTGVSVWLDEQVGSVHVSTGHAAGQLVERIRWAIRDAEDAERKLADRRMPLSRRARSRQAPARPRARGPVPVPRLVDLRPGGL